MPSCRPREDRLLQVIKLQSEIAKLGLDLNAVMTLVAQQSRIFTDAAGAVVEIAEEDEMVYRAVSGITESRLGLRLRRDASLSGLCVQEGRPLRCDDAENDPRVDLAACRAVGVRSMIVAPLKYDQSVVGALKVMSPLPSAFDESDLEILALLSDVIAASVYHSKKYTSTDLFHQATHDGLTGLANRALFFYRLRKAIAQAQRDGQRISVVNLDMDGLKPVNDQLGHRAGDYLLAEFARRLASCAREGDTVARVGGDEFAVILSNAETSTQADQADAFTKRLTAQLAEPAMFKGHALLLRTSLGVAVFPQDGDNPEALLHCADERMYAAKRKRKEASLGATPT
jgi:diguanylate cyclase (GGDEF)-like protein